MFTLHGVTLRPIEFKDIDTLYVWDSDINLEMAAGWGPKQSKAAYRQRRERRIVEPAENLTTFGVQVEGQLVGEVQLALIDTANRHAMLGIVIGARDVWGQGIGSTALRILIDDAFTVRGLERVYAEIYDFNTHSQHLFEKLGFVHEGVLRQHELHNGSLRNMHIFGMLKDEFYQRYETIFQLPT